MESAGILILEFCLLCFIGVLYWAAKKNLTAAASRQQTETLKEIRQVEETIQGLLDVLESKASEIESRLSRFSLDEIDQHRSVRVTPAERPLVLAANDAFGGSDSQIDAYPGPQVAHESPEFARDLHDINVGSRSFEDALRLVDGGSDPRTVARTTGLTIAEIETAIRMRQLRGEGADALDRTNTQEISS